MSNNKRHNLDGGCSENAIDHSDRHSKGHNDFKLRKGIWSRDTIVNPLHIPSVENIKFLEGVSLETKGNLCWIAEDGELQSVDGDTMTTNLNKFVYEVERLGGPYRKASVKDSNGESYLQKAKTVKPLQRYTVPMPPWFSKAWLSGNEQWRVKAKKIVVGILFSLAKERWPDAEIKGLSLHDDTSNLHFDIWATELEKKTVTLRNKAVDKFVTKGQVFNSGLCGPGTMFLQAKQDLGHKLHLVDESKLKRSLGMYKSHRDLTKKILPEVPEEITFYRALDKNLTSLFTDKSFPQKLKAEYLEFCKRLEYSKYSTFDELSSLKSREIEIETRENSLQKSVEEYVTKTEELETMKEEAEGMLEAVNAKTKPERDVLIKLWKSPKVRPHLVKNFPKTIRGLVCKLKFNKDPEVIQMCSEIREVFGMEKK